MCNVLTPSISHEGSLHTLCKIDFYNPEHTNASKKIHTMPLVVFVDSNFGDVGRLDFSRIHQETYSSKEMLPIYTIDNTRLIHLKSGERGCGCG